MNQSGNNNAGAAWEAYSAHARAALSCGRYADAERLYTAALKIAETFCAEDGRLFATLKALAAFYELRGEYPTALTLYRRALVFSRRTLGEPREVRDLETKCDLLDQKTAIAGNIKENPLFYK